MTFAEIREMPVFFSGIFDLQWWQLALIALALTHVTIAAVTIFLHRHQGMGRHPSQASRQVRDCL